MKIIQSGLGLYFRLVLLFSLALSFSNCTDSVETRIPEIPNAPMVEVGDGELHVMWEEVVGANSYEVWVHTSDDSNTAIRAAIEVKDTYYTITDLENGTTYYVWIKAKNNSGTSGFSHSSNAEPNREGGGEMYYYEGTITVTTNGITNDSDKDSFDEETIYTGVKIKEWHMMEGENWWGYSFSCNALVKVDDWYGDDPKIHRTFDGQFTYVIEQGGSTPDIASLHLFKTEEGTYKYTLTISTPKSEDVNNSGPMRWIYSPGELTMGEFMPQVIEGEFTDDMFNDGVTTKVAWQLERRIEYF